MGHQGMKQDKGKKGSSGHELPEPTELTGPKGTTGHSER